MHNQSQDQRPDPDTSSASLQYLLLATVLLSLGSGLLTIMIPIGGEAAGFSVTLIGALGTSNYVGFIVGCLLLPALISRVGHIRSFTAVAAVAASGTLVFVLAVTPLTWLLLRAVVGFCFAGLFMVVESWLNATMSPWEMSSGWPRHTFPRDLGMGTNRTFAYSGLKSRR